MDRENALKVLVVVGGALFGLCTFLGCGLSFLSSETLLPGNDLPKLMQKYILRQSEDKETSLPFLRKQNSWFIKRRIPEDISEETV